ncbi:MAG TPA: D-alanyl-D-alanine carboxypeptidase family protein, partial [Lacisediminihabitans sp.]|uniref:M15 family metallopeptidase n=1 Tax=Lacisediminihabitans sp. TaxID=2787631 RepID=UPI002EDA6379
MDSPRMGQQTPGQRTSARRRRLIVGIVSAVIVVALVIAGVLAFATPRGRSESPRASAPHPTKTSATPRTSSTPVPSPTPTFDAKALSIDDPTSIWVVANKLRPLQPADYVPPDLVETPVAHQNPPPLRKEAADAMVTMFAAAKAEGGGAMELQSAYRSYTTQVAVYNGWVTSSGQAGADAQSARPGYSEHQTGLAADIGSVPLQCTLAACFGQTTQGKWLAANAWRFGFLLRYPADKVAVTG